MFAIRTMPQRDTIIIRRLNTNQSAVMSIRVRSIVTRLPIILRDSSTFEIAITFRAIAIPIHLNLVGVDHITSKRLSYSIGQDG